MADANILITGDEKQFLQSLARAEAAEQKLEHRIDSVGAAGAKAGEQVGGSMEKAGRRGMSEFDKLLRELRKTGPEGRKQAAEIEKHLQHTGKQGRQSVGTIIDKLGDIDPEVRRVAKNAEGEFAKVGKAGQQAFGADAVASLAKFAAGWMSVNTVVGLAGEAMQRVREEQAKAFSSLDQQSDPNKRLLQVSTDAEDYQNLTGQADKLAMEYGISREEARGLMFSGRSEGFEQSAGFIASNAQVLDVASQATVAGQVPGLFQKEGLTAEEAINMGLTAAAESRLNFEEIARAMPGAAEGGAIAGASSGETFGALSVLAGRFKSGDTAADRLKAFTSRVGLDEGNAEMGRESLQGTGIVDAVQKLQAMNEEQRKDFLGDSQEVNAAYVILVEEFAKIQERIGKIQEAQNLTGTSQSPIAMRRGIAQSDPQLRALQEQRAAENRREIANERANAEQEANRRARQDRVVAGAKNRGQSEFGIAVGEMAGDAFRQADMLNVVGVDVGAESRAVNAVEAIVGGDLAALQRSASLAAESSFNPQATRTLEAIKFGANRLGQRDQQAEPGTLGQLSRQESASFLQQATGQQIGLESITPEIQSELTRQIRSAAEVNPQQSKRDYSYINPAIMLSKLAFGGAGGTERIDAAAILPEVKIDRLIQLMEQSVANTSPASRPVNPPNYSAGLQTGADAAAMP